MLFTTPPKCARAATSSITSGYRSRVTNKVTYSPLYPKAACTAPKCFSTRISTENRQICFNSKARTQCLRANIPRAQKPTNVRFVRYNSTTASETSTAASEPHPPLTWNRYLALRKIRRRINLGASVITCAATTMGGIAFLSQADLDRFLAEWSGFDPFVVLGLSTFACAGVGWLMGPFVGSAVFNLAYRGLKPEIMAKEKDFFKRIQKNRSDPSNSSLQNPIPDYYGEKIGSVKDYRTWLRDQRAFRLKRDRA